MVVENSLFLKDLIKVLRANSGFRHVINVRVTELEKEFTESIKSENENNLLFTDKESITLADVLDRVKEELKNDSEIILINGTNTAGFSQIEYCRINLAHLEKQSAAKLILSSRVEMLNSNGYFSDDVL